MPIYKFKAPVTVKATTIKKKEFFALYGILREASKTFIYKDDKSFLNSLKWWCVVNNDDELVFLDYNIQRSNLNDVNYTAELSSLIDEANVKLKENKKYRNRDYRFDIVGDWTRGFISIITRV